MRTLINSNRRISSLFVKSGHHKDDLENVSYDLSQYFEAQTDFSRVTRSSEYFFLSLRLTMDILILFLGFQSIRPHVEHLVLEQKRLRLAQERLDLVKSREEVVKKVYLAYKQTMPPSTWAYFPPAYIICEIPFFAELINSSSYMRLEDHACADGVKLLPAFVNAWQAEKLRELASYLPDASDDPDTRTMDLATSVFTCKGSSVSPLKAGSCLIGWHDAGAHLRCGSLRMHWDHRLHFSPRGHDAATALIELLGLDPTSALATDLDRLDSRFMCANCPEVRQRGPNGRAILKWRECVRF